LPLAKNALAEACRTTYRLAKVMNHHGFAYFTFSGAFPMRLSGVLQLVSALVSLHVAAKELGLKILFSNPTLVKYVLLLKIKKVTFFTGWYTVTLRVAERHRTLYGKDPKKQGQQRGA
jgi:hypothetical protein